MSGNKLIVLIMLAFLLIGCRTAPIMDIKDAPINTASGKTIALKAVTEEIIDAGVQLGWQMKKEKPGHILATLYLRDHMVRVDIHYSQAAYSISYNDSSNMKYDGTSIHANYNSWIQNLSNGIRTQVYNSSN